MAISSGPNVGTVSTWLAANTTPKPRPTPASAVTIGKPIATTEPKASSMMMTAAVMPNPSLEPGAAVTTFSTGDPPTATWSPGRAKLRATVTTRVTALPGRFAATASNCTTMKPVRPSADNCRAPPVASGLATPETVASGRSSRTSLPTSAALAPLVRELPECRTTSAVSPACAGKRRASRFSAC